jgi:uncharacterized protein YcbX
MAEPAVRVDALFIYPIKGCGGIAVDAARIVARGFEHDRRWMVVDEAGVFVSQRTHPALALVRVARAAPQLVLTAPGAPPLAIPLAHEEGPRVSVEVWSHRGEAVRHEAGSAWFSAYLGGAYRLVYMAEDHHRPIRPEHARPGDIVSFADAYPFLVISRASLDDLNRRLESPLPMDRFRPSIVIAGASPFAEDDYARVAIGEVAFRGSKRCDRCAVTTVDQQTGVRGKEPLRTLATFRQQDSKVWFGMNLIHEGAGTLHVGDLVRPS